MKLSNIYYPEVKAGDVILFPSHMLHGVSPHGSDTVRKTFSFNVVGQMSEVYLTENFMSGDTCDWFTSFHETMFPFYGTNFENRKIINLTELIHVLHNNTLPYDVTDYLKQTQADLITEVKKYDPQAFPNYIHCTKWTAPYLPTNSHRF